VGAFDTKFIYNYPRLSLYDQSSEHLAMIKSRVLIMFRQKLNKLTKV